MKDVKKFQNLQSKGVNLEPLDLRLFVLNLLLDVVKTVPNSCGFVMQICNYYFNTGPTTPSLYNNLVSFYEVAVPVYRAIHASGGNIRKYIHLNGTNERDIILKIQECLKQEVEA
jgi:hypothetical protein